MRVAADHALLFLAASNGDLVYGVRCRPTAARFAGSADGIGHALGKLADRVVWWRWLLFRLSHPPNRVRQWLVRHSDSTVGFVVVLLFFPLTYILELLIGLGSTLFRNLAWNWQSFIARAAERTTETAYADTWVNLVSSIKTGLGEFVTTWIVMAGLLLLWPFLERHWQRFFSRERGRILGRPKYQGYFLSGLILVALSGLLYGAVPAIPVPQPQPAEIPEKGILPPDWYTTDEFKPALTFSVGDGWIISEESNGYFVLSDEEGNYVMFEHVRGILDPKSSGIKLDNVLQSPSDHKAYWLVGELMEHPELSSPDKVLSFVKVGGARGVQLTLEVSSSVRTTNHPSDCQDPCLPLFLNSEYVPHYWIQGRTYRVFVLDVHGELVVITAGNLQETDSANQLNEFWPRAKDVLATVRWKE